MTKPWLGNDGLWETELYQSYKKENFEILDKFLGSAPMKILDIGCGLAWESRLFNEKYGCELWLLDGDATEGNKNKSKESSDVKYHQSADSFLLYHSFEKLQSELDKLGTKNYHLIDCNNINIPEDIKFDLITSWVSCGFHYPVNTYKDLILKHSHANTRVVMDLRVIYKKTNMPEKEEGVEIINVISQRNKYIMAELKLS
jgi:SAM-dependent methyltransferase